MRGPTLGLFCCFGSCRAGASPPQAPLWLLVDWVLWVVQAQPCTWAVVVLADAHSLGGEQGPLCLPAPPLA